MSVRRADAPHSWNDSPSGPKHDPSCSCQQTDEHDDAWLFDPHGTIGEAAARAAQGLPGGSFDSGEKIIQRQRAENAWQYEAGPPPGAAMKG